MRISTAAVALLAALAAAPTERAADAFVFPAASSKRRTFASIGSSGTEVALAAQVRFRHAFDATAARSSESTASYTYDVNFPEGDRKVGVPAHMLNVASHGQRRPLMKLDNEEAPSDRLEVGTRVEVNFRAGVISKVRRVIAMPREGDGGDSDDGSSVFDATEAAEAQMELEKLNSAPSPTKPGGGGGADGFVVDAVQPATETAEGFDDEPVAMVSSDADAFAAFASDAASDLREVNGAAATFEPPAPVGIKGGNGDTVLFDAAAEAAKELERLDAAAAKAEKLELELERLEEEATAAASEDKMTVPATPGGGGKGAAALDGAAVEPEALGASEAQVSPKPGAKMELKEADAPVAALNKPPPAGNSSSSSSSTPLSFGIPPPFKASVPAAPPIEASPAASEEEATAATTMPGPAAGSSYLDSLQGPSVPAASMGSTPVAAGMAMRSYLDDLHAETPTASIVKEKMEKETPAAATIPSLPEEVPVEMEAKMVASPAKLEAKVKASSPAYGPAGKKGKEEEEGGDTEKEGLDALVSLLASGELDQDSFFDELEKSMTVIADGPMEDEADEPGKSQATTTTARSNDERLATLTPPHLPPLPHLLAGGGRERMLMASSVGRAALRAAQDAAHDLAGQLDRTAHDFLAGHWDPVVRDVAERLAKAVRAQDLAGKAHGIVHAVQDARHVTQKELKKLKRREQPRRREEEETDEYWASAPLRPPRPQLHSPAAVPALRQEEETPDDESPASSLPPAHSPTTPVPPSPPASSSSSSSARPPFQVQEAAPAAPATGDNDGGEAMTAPPPPAGSYLDGLRAASTTSSEAVGGTAGASETANCGGVAPVSSYLDGLQDPVAAAAAPPRAVPENVGRDGSASKTPDVMGAASYLNDIAAATADADTDANIDADADPRLAKLDAKVEILSAARASLRNALQTAQAHAHNCRPSRHGINVVDTETMAKIDLLGRAERSLRVAIERARNNGSRTKTVEETVADRVESALDSTIAKIEEIRRKYEQEQEHDDIGVL